MPRDPTTHALGVPIGPMTVRQDDDPWPGTTVQLILPDVAQGYVGPEPVEVRP